MGLESSNKFRILLLTHKDSDNLGDQFIEACDLAILSTIMRNLECKPMEYEIISEKAAIVSPKYINTKDPDLLKKADKLIKNADIIIVGGAPQFNYIYQYFSERSIVFMNLAKKYNKPIIFSAVGIEDYNPENEKCQRLRRALNYNCVKMVTTRDSFEDLLKLKSRADMFIAHVADPAVYAGIVFKNFCRKEVAKEKIGIFIIRGTAFEDNNIGLSYEESAKMWIDLINELERRGMDYELITSGHFSDEAFMDYLVRQCGVKLSKCVFNMYKPEQLIEKISTYAGVISCRLHPGILSYSLKVPAIGIEWNPKVSGFYNSIGYGDRVVRISDFEASNVIDLLQRTMQEGVHHDIDFIYSLYRTLFDRIKEQLGGVKSNILPYTYKQIIDEIMPYKGTTLEEAEDKLRRKTRRCYNNYNIREEELRKIDDKYNLSKNPLMVHYFTQGGNNVLCQYSLEEGHEKLFKNGGHEYTSSKLLFHNDGRDLVAQNQFIRPGFRFIGWKLRFRINKLWFWYMNDGSISTKSDMEDGKFNERKFIFEENSYMPVIPINCIDSIVFEASWKEEK